MNLQAVDTRMTQMPRRLIAAFLIALWPAAAAAQASPAASGYAVPNFWDPSSREERPDLSNRPAIRFLTEAQSPPFSFIGADGRPTGFHVDVARAICLELEVACTIQTLRWELLLDGIDDDRGDAIIAGLAIDEASRERFRFSSKFLSRPARFVTRRDTEIGDALPEDLEGKSVAVVRGTAHEAYLRDFFAGAERVPFDTERAARDALLAGQIDVLFGDGLNLSLWLNGAASRACCTFRGGPYAESRYFGEGIAVAVAADDDVLQRAVDYGLARIQADGTYGEIYQRYFPVSFY